MKGQKSSIVHLPVSLSRSDLEATINKLVNGVIYEDSDSKDDGLMMKAEKAGVISLELDSEKIRYEVPLKIWVKKDTAISDLEVDGVIMIRFSTSYKIRDTWDLQTETQIIDHQWIEKPKAQISFLNISVKFLADKILERSEKVITETIDQQLVKQLDLKTKLNEAWNYLRHPIALSKDYELWFKVRGEQLSMSPFHVEEGEIKATLLLKGHTNLESGQKPETLDEVAIPAFQYSESSADDFAIQLGGRISYEMLEKIARQFLIGQSFTFNKYDVTVKALSLNPIGDKLKATLDLAGTYEGAFELMGRPIYNATKKQVEFENLVYEMDADNILFQGIGWLFQRTFERKLKEAMRFPLQPHLKNLKILAEGRLADFPIGSLARLNGDLETLDLLDAAFRKDGIEVLLAASGRAKVRVSNLERGEG